MQLSQNFFAELTGLSVNAPGAADAQNERRAHPRIAFDRRARIFPLMEGAGEAGTPILVRDVSLGGIGFLCADPLSIGDEFIVRIFTKTDQPIDIQCAVRRCEMGGTCGSQFAIGATFELVLNRSIASSIAPESEMVADEEPLVDQPALPTIEQRFDHQSIEARLISPIIRETRLDRWLAKPPIKKIVRCLTISFWPILLLYKAIRLILQAGEASRIRSRLTPNKSRRKKTPRTKNPSANAVPATAKPMESSIKSDPDVNVSLMKTLHPALFREYEADPAEAPAAVAPIQRVRGKSSIFAPPESEISAPPVMSQSEIKSQLHAPVAAPSIPTVHEVASEITSQVAAAPQTITTLPANAAFSSHPAIESISPPEPPAAMQIEERTGPPSIDPAPLPQPATGAVHQTIQQGEQPTPPQNHPATTPRPPVTHPRHMRRRTRPTFHR